MDNGREVGKWGEECLGEEMNLQHGDYLQGLGSARWGTEGKVVCLQLCGLAKIF